MVSECQTYFQGLGLTTFAVIERSLQRDLVTPLHGGPSVELPYTPAPTSLESGEIKRREQASHPLLKPSVISLAEHGHHRARTGMTRVWCVTGVGLDDHNLRYIAGDIRS
jgi:hypothetical protein